MEKPGLKNLAEHGWKAEVACLLTPSATIAQVGLVAMSGGPVSTAEPPAKINLRRENFQRFPSKLTYNAVTLERGALSLYAPEVNALAPPLKQ